MARKDRIFLREIMVGDERRSCILKPLFSNEIDRILGVFKRETGLSIKRE